MHRSLRQQYSELINLPGAWSDQAELPKMWVLEEPSTEKWAKLLIRYCHQESNLFVNEYRGKICIRLSLHMAGVKYSIPTKNLLGCKNVFGSKSPQSKGSEIAANWLSMSLTFSILNKHSRNWSCFKLKTLCLVSSKKLIPCPLKVFNFHRK